jgi:hypothetical protein
MMTSKILAISASICLLAGATQAAVTFNIIADTLRTAGGTAMPQTGLVMLVASTTDGTFGGLSQGSSLALNSLIADGNDQILAKWNLVVNETDGLFADTTGPLNFSGNWGATDKLALLWFPTLTLSSSSLVGGESYGLWSGPPNLQDGGDAWTTPGDGSTVSLNFLTSTGGGTHATALGNASLTVSGAAVIPEPSRAFLLLGGLVGLAMRRRRA